ncbi:RNA polymerase II transcription factor B subunit 1, partial [Ascosphaera atra]
SDYTLGSDTCLNALVNFCDVIRLSASSSRHRVFVVETQGGRSGYVATVAGLAVGAYAVYIPEEGITLDTIQKDVQWLRESFNTDAGINHNGKVILRNERASTTYTTEVLTSIIRQENGGRFETRSAVPGHFQQGGKPSPMDRVRALRLAVRCMQHLETLIGKSGNDIMADELSAAVIGIKGGDVVISPMGGSTGLEETETDWDERRPKREPWQALQERLDRRRAALPSPVGLRDIYLKVDKGRFPHLASPAPLTGGLIQTSSNMAPPTAPAAYKKKDGILAVSDNQKSISWTPSGGGASPLTIDVTRIKSKPKVMLKILTTVTKEGEPDNYVFHFTSPTNARAEADAIKEVLQTAINNVKASQTPQPAGEAGASAGGTMAIAGAFAPKAAKPLWEDDQRLLADIELQQSLLKANSALQRIFMESLSTKSENVANSRFVAQFWSTRLPLLRAHAFERSQQRGSYNVLASLKPRTEGAAMKLNISKEQISLIFNQHPLVKRAYDENVPQVSEQQFWSRFFQSRLFKKLRGERISENDASDSVLDKYLHVDEKEAEKPDTRIPHFIDLYGNEENHSQRLGNRPEIDMRPSTLDRVPIIRTLNSLSEKIMSNVSPSDVDPAAPVGMSEEEFDRHQLMLRDLEGDAEVKRFVLNIRDQSKLFSGGKPESQEMEVGAESHPIRVQDPRKSIKRLRHEVESTYPNDSADLGSIVEPGDSDEDSDEETQGGQQPKKKKTEHMGSKSSMQRASNQILDALRTRRAQEEAPASKDNKADTFGLSRTIFDRLTLTHATSTEFLHQFWQAYLGQVNPLWPRSGLQHACM